MPEGAKKLSRREIKEKAKQIKADKRIKKQMESEAKLRDRFEKNKIQSYADAYNFDDRVGHIKSVGNGL